MCFVGGENIPEILEVNTFPSLHQFFWILAVESKMPDVWRIVDRLPTWHAGQKCVHHGELLCFVRKLRGICVRNHQSDVMADHTRLVAFEREREVMDLSRRIQHVDL